MATEAGSWTHHNKQYVVWFTRLYVVRHIPKRSMGLPYAYIVPPWHHPNRSAYNPYMECLGYVYTKYARNIAGTKDQRLKKPSPEASERVGLESLRLGG